MIPLSSQSFERYLYFLRRVVNFKTLFNRPDQIELAMDWCHEFFSKSLKGYRVYRDGAENLIACPQQINPNNDIVYLSAHMDTVDADPKEWDAPFRPFSLYEDEHQIVARGVSDCKAGVAFELFLADLAFRAHMSCSNLVFTVTFKEEGAGEKTARQIGKDLGTRLPLSKKDTFFIVLENTVSMGDPSVLCYYTAERGNFVIRASDTLAGLKTILSKLGNWNPVSICPKECLDFSVEKVLSQAGGHVCSVPRTKNLLTRVIESSDDNTLILAGDESGFGVVPTRINLGKSSYPVIHDLVLSNRSFDSVDFVYEQLEGITYTQVKPFSISQGMNVDSKFGALPICRVFNSYNDEDIIVSKDFNIGASDATIVSRSMTPEYKHRFYPIVVGPGTRSQKNATPPRLTHGKNETFDKASGRACVGFLIHALSEMGVIKCNGLKEGL